MNREIKFRAWIKANKRIENCVGVNPWHIHDCDRVYWKHDEVELMQYTGLKDKNGKDIYESDIIKNEDRYHKVIGIIKFGKVPDHNRDEGGHQGFYIEWQDKNSNRWSEWWRCDLNYWRDKIEVISNLFENPELLEAENE